MKLIDWLKGLFTKPEVQTVTDITASDTTTAQTATAAVADPAATTVATEPTEPTVAPATETIVQTVEADLDAFAAKLKSVLLLAGHDVESVFAEAVALAKKL